jgi:predicted Fe-Mo cluster-binding NifX family protein
MRIAVASRDGRTVAGHIGKCKQWLVFDVEKSERDKEPQAQQAEQITLQKSQVFHHFKDEGPHPLSDCVAVIGASAGESFISKMARRGITAVLTAETDPAKAVADYVIQKIIPPKPRPIGGLICKIRDAISSEK